MAVMSVSPVHTFTIKNVLLSGLRKTIHAPIVSSKPEEKTWKKSSDLIYWF